MVIFLTKKNKGNINKVLSFFEKPSETRAKQIIKKKVIGIQECFI